MKNVSNSALFQQIPAVDRVMGSPEMKTYIEGMPGELVTRVIRSELDAIRNSIRNEDDEALSNGEILSHERVFERLQQRFQNTFEASLKPVINGTGIVLHTNFGRAPLSEKALDAITSTGRGYNNLEYDVAQRTRGSRHSHVEKLLQQLLNVEAALIVNNCAAAVLLGLAAMSHGKETIVSRGELVEIGGSFRIPEVMESAGAILKEVGTTNRTHLKDYEKAINERTGLLLKAYRSNFEIVGFTKEVSLEELVALGKKHDIPTMMDLGCGLIVDLKPYGIDRGTRVQSIVEKGVDIICFSGDKLLGGPQCGIIVGTQKMIKTLRNHPMTRALRVDKMVLSGLEATLASYAEGKWREELPGHRMLTLSVEEAMEKATILRDKITTALGKDSVLSCAIVDTEGKVGGGTLPLEVLHGKGVRISSLSLSPDDIERHFRACEVPIIGRVTDDGFILDVRTLFPWQFDRIVNRLLDLTPEVKG